MKARRQMRIMEIIRAEAISTQEELARRLQKEGIHVTQATVSRDIKEMQLLKIPTGDGRYRYALPDDRGGGSHADRLVRMLREAVISYDAGENLIVINTLPATAPSVAEAIDLLNAEEVLGTLAGERTVFVAIRSKEAAPRFLERLKGLIG